MTSRPTILLVHTVSPERSEDLRSEFESSLPVRNAETPEETVELLSGADMIVAGRFYDEWFEHTESLQLIQSLWAGVDWYSIDRIESEGVALANSAGVHSEPIAQQVLGYLLAFERGFVETMHNQHRGVWERVEGGELGGKTLGIIGVGSIGSRVAELATPFGMDVVGTKRDLSESPDTVDELLPADEYHQLLGRSEYVLVSCPLTDETEGMLDIDEFRLMDSDAVLINVARGEIIDQNALVRALQYKRIRGAALDVFEEEPLPPESPLWNLSNVVITPHMAWRTPRTTDRWVEIIERNYEAIARNDLDKLVNRVV